MARLRIQDILETIVAFVTLNVAVVCWVNLMFRFGVAAAARRRRFGQSWPRAFAGAAADAVRYTFLRLVRFADAADREVRTERTASGNPVFDHGIFAFWVGGVTLAMGLAMVAPALVYGLGRQYLERLVDDQAATMWMSTYVIILPAMIVLREREVVRRTYRQLGELQERHERMLATFGDAGDLRDALAREAGRIVGLNARIEALGAAPKEDASAEFAYYQEVGKLQSALQVHMRRQHHLRELLEAQERKGGQIPPRSSLPVRVMAECFDVPHTT